MNSDTQLKIQAYLDNELSHGEARQIAGMLTNDRDAQELYSELRSTREVLAGNEPEIKLGESREFYWSRIKSQIERAERAPVSRSGTPWWLRLAAPLLGTAALLGLLAMVSNPADRVTLKRSGDTLASRPLHGEVEDLAPEVSSVTFRSEEDGVTVVWLSARE